MTMCESNSTLDASLLELQAVQPSSPTGTVECAHWQARIRDVEGDQNMT